MSKCRRPLLYLFVGAATISLFLAFQILRGGLTIFAPTAPPQPSSKPEQRITWDVPKESLSEEELQIKEALLGLPENQDLPIPHNQVLSIRGVKIEGDWAFVDGPVVAVTGQPTSGEGLIILLRRLEGKWVTGYPGTSQYEEWLELIPESLIPSDLKMFLR